MSPGPVELLVATFPENEATHEMALALKELIENGTIRIIDLLFLKKDQDGNVTKIEVNDLEDESFAEFDPLISNLTGLMSNEDIDKLSNSLPTNHSAGIMLYEKTWATRFRNALEKAEGKIVFSERIPNAVIDQALAAQQTSG